MTSGFLLRKYMTDLVAFVSRQYADVTADQSSVVVEWSNPISDNQHGIQKQLKGLHTIPENISVRRSMTWSNMAAEKVRVSTCQESLRIWWQQCRCSPGSVFCLLPGVTSGCARPITGQVTSVTWPVIGWAQPELTPSKKQKTAPDLTNPSK